MRGTWWHWSFWCWLSCLLGGFFQYRGTETADDGGEPTHTAASFREPRTTVSRRQRARLSVMMITGAPILQVQVHTGRAYQKLRLKRNDGDKPVFGPVHLKPEIKFRCYARGYTLRGRYTHVGQIPASYCAVIYSPCTTLPDSTALETSQTVNGSTCERHAQPVAPM